MKFLVFVAFLVLASASAERARFDNYRVYNVKIENEEQYQALKYLQDYSDSYEFWDDPHVNRDAEVLVPPHMFAHFEEISQNLKLQTNLVIGDFQKLIDEEARQSKRKMDIEGHVGWEAYYTYAQISAWLDQLAANYSSVASVRTVGTSHLGRAIKMITITKASPDKKYIMVEANIHSREWISSATATYLINQLLTTNSALATNNNWLIIPVANPDGYEHSRTTSRNWRKNRKPITQLCTGVDNNRNFAYNWLTADETGSLGASTSACSDTYAGPSAHSEEETKAVDSILTEYRSRMGLFLSFHAYGHYLLWAWGHTRQAPSNQAELNSVGTAFRSALSAVNGINYTIGSVNTVLYAASGSSPDHATGHHGIAHAYTLEMRGNGVYGNHGFVLPPNLILPNCLEVMAGLNAMVTRLRELSVL